MVEEVPDTRVQGTQPMNTREGSLENDQKTKSTNKYLSEFLKTEKPRKQNPLSEEQDQKLSEKRLKYKQIQMEIDRKLQELKSRKNTVSTCLQEYSKTINKQKIAPIQELNEESPRPHNLPA